MAPVLPSAPTGPSGKASTMVRTRGAVAGRGWLLVEGSEIAAAGSSVLIDGAGSGNVGGDGEDAADVTSSWAAQ